VAEPDPADILEVDLFAKLRGDPVRQHASPVSKSIGSASRSRNALTGRAPRPGTGSQEGSTLQSRAIRCCASRKGWSTICMEEFERAPRCMRRKSPSVRTSSPLPWALARQTGSPSLASSDCSGSPGGCFGGLRKMIPRASELGAVPDPVSRGGR
jgi:hypothetical protein